MMTVRELKARSALASRILQDRMPWATINPDNGQREAALSVLQDPVEVVVQLFAGEIAVHLRCDNYRKAQELRDQCASLIHEMSPGNRRFACAAMLDNARAIV